MNRLLSEGRAPRVPLFPTLSKSGTRGACPSDKFKALVVMGIGPGPLHGPPHVGGSRRPRWPQLYCTMADAEDGVPPITCEAATRFSSNQTSPCGVSLVVTIHSAEH